MASHLFRILSFLAVFCFLRTSALKYLFTAPEYTLEESASVYTAEVILQRTADISGDTVETSVPSSINLNVQCPEECPAMSGAELAVQNSDYTIATKTINFAANELQKAVEITIADDGESEQREYFCLSVMDDTMRGSQWSARVIIPWNDDCIRHYSIQDGGMVETSSGYGLQANGYIGPWSPADAGTITFKITPQSTADAGDGRDISIFLTTEADISSASINSYGIHLDDQFANLHGGTTVDASYFSKDGIANLIGTEDTATDFVEVDAENTFELSYIDGTITLERTSPSPATFSVTDEAYAIGHLFVSAAVDKFANWEICGLEPNRLPIEKVQSSGFTSSFDHDKVKDGLLGPESCFISEADADGKHWLQIDLGREYEVSRVIIFPMILDDVPTGLANPEWLDNALVYVGSCRSDDITSNHECSDDIGDVADAAASTQVAIIDLTCSGTNVYGQYVYIVPQTDTNQFTLCDIMVYGSEVPSDLATKVSFTQDSIAIAENDATGIITLPITRSGDGRTCTYVDYYTDNADGDFTEILANAAKEVKISGSTDTQSIPITVSLIDDEVCESTESYGVYLTGVEGGRLVDQCSATFQISDDDAVTYSIVPGVTSLIEGGSFEIPVRRSGTGLMQDGSATLIIADVSATLADYSNTNLPVAFTSTSDDTQVATVSTNDDQCFEGTETFQVSLNYLEPAECSGVGAGLPLLFTIVDNDSQFQWDVSSDSLTLSESVGSSVVNIIRMGTSVSKTIEIDIDYGTTDATGTDFSITPEDRMVTFSPGESSQFITITIADDYDVEGDETFSLTLRDPNGDSCSNGNRGEPYKLSVTLTDNDGELGWQRAAYSLVESDGHTQVCLVRGGNPNTPLTVNITSTSGTATIEEDFQPLTYLIFPTSNNTVCAQVQILGDLEIEEDETFVLSITSGQDFAVGSRTSTTITIIDDDAVIRWAEPGYEFEEGEVAVVYITKEGDLDVTAKVISSAGTATSDDFQEVSMDFAIPASATSYALTLHLVDDNIPEASESFALTLQASTTGLVLQGLTTITILDNDGGIAGTTSRPGTGDDGGLGGGAIAGIIAALLLGILTLAISCCLFYYFGLFGRLCRRNAVPQPEIVRRVSVVPSENYGQLAIVPLQYSYGNAFGLVSANPTGYSGYSNGLVSANPTGYSGYSNYGTRFQDDPYDNTPLALTYSYS